MPRQKASGSPDAHRLYQHALAQSGFFTMSQANEANYSRELLNYYLRTNKITRASRGIFRLTGIQPTRLSPLIPLWLWSGKIGTFSGETGLFIHQLLDELPAAQHLIVPRAWKKRRITIPEGARLFYEDPRPGSYQIIESLQVMLPDLCIADALITGTPLAVINAVAERKNQPPSP